MDFLERIRVRQVMDKNAKNLKDIVNHDEYYRLLDEHGWDYLYPKGYQPPRRKPQKSTVTTYGQV